jgi:sugar phosphate isomerase/epimerase
VVDLFGGMNPTPPYRFEFSRWSKHPFFGRLWTGAIVGALNAQDMPDGPSLSLRCNSLWDGPRPADPQELLKQLPAELTRMRNSGASFVEFKTDVCVVDVRYRDHGIWERVKDRLRASGLAGATIHLPAAWVDLASLDHEVWEGSIRSVKAALRATAPLNPILAAVHPAGDATGEWVRSLPDADRQAARSLVIERVVDALRRLRELPEAEPLALENLEGAGCELIALIADRSGINVCLDVGHVVSNGEALAQALDAVASRLRGIHLHDAVPPYVGAGKGKAHLPLGSGILDLKMLLRALQSNRFTGPVVLEVKGEFSDSVSRFLEAKRTIVSSVSQPPLR